KVGNRHIYAKPGTGDRRGSLAEQKPVNRIAHPNIKLWWPALPVYGKRPVQREQSSARGDLRVARKRCCQNVGLGLVDHFQACLDLRVSFEGRLDRLFEGEPTRLDHSWLWGGRLPALWCSAD